VIDQIAIKIMSTDRDNHVAALVPACVQQGNL
jgi:hypothetical protein